MLPGACTKDIKCVGQASIHGKQRKNGQLSANLANICLKVKVVHTSIACPTQEGCLLISASACLSHPGDTIGLSASQSCSHSNLLGTAHTQTTTQPSNPCVHAYATVCPTASTHVDSQDPNDPQESARSFLNDFLKCGVQWVWCVFWQKKVYTL